MKKIITTLLFLVSLSAQASFEDKRLAEADKMLEVLQHYSSYRIANYLIRKNYKPETHVEHLDKYQKQLQAQGRKDEALLILMYAGNYIELLFGRR